MNLMESDMKSWVMGGAASVLLAGVCLAQQAPEASLTVTFSGVNSAKGVVNLSLCNDPKGQFPGMCSAYSGKAQAVAGDTVVTIQGIKPGRYALQAWHDANSNNMVEIPGEGFAYGNDTGFPTSFEAASIDVAGPTRTAMKMTYQASAAPARRLGSKGAPAPAGVARIDVREKGLYGELYLPQGGKDLPALILLGGSEGGLDGVSGMAAAFAQKGYAALALAYWAEEGLPQTLESIPLEYFDRGVDWLIARPETANGGVGALGWSRGSEAALLLGSRNRKVKAVVAVAPSGIVWDGLDFANMGKEESAWTAGGKPLPFVTPKAEYYRGTSMREMFLMSLDGANERPETAIPVERINGPILLLSGMDDALWPSTHMSDRIIARLQGARFRHSYEHRAYPGAGHAVFVTSPESPMARSASQPNPMMGGTPQGNARAWADNWPTTVAFLDKALKGKGK